MMFTTSLRAIDPSGGELKKWCGPHVEAISWDMAQRWCEENGFGYLEVDGILEAEIDEETGEKTRFDFHLN